MAATGIRDTGTVVALRSRMTLATLIVATAVSTLAARTNPPQPSRDAGTLATARPTPAPHRVSTSLRANGGIGVLAYQAGAEGEYWFAGWAGAGLQGGAFGAGLFDKTQAYGGGLHLALRTSPTGSSPLLTVGGGIAQVRETMGKLCLDWNGDGCPPDETHSSVGPYLDAGLGWLFHPSWPNSGIELGPILRLDVAGRIPAVTLNFAIGYASVR
ncbi:MAG: hypothetical protein JW940_10930 [Polyangiaceae bacterium]|nr:hypothetical protein [Polyangiaceae bacterium]